MVTEWKEKAFLMFIYAVLLILVIAVIFPLLYVLSVSLTPYSEVLKHGGFIVIPRKITFEAYSMFLKNSIIPKSYLVTFFITAAGTLINLILTSLMAYPLSKKDLPGRSMLLFLILFTLLFNGGVVPTYLIVKATGLLDSLWSMIIPQAIWSFNLLIMKSFFENLPVSLDESARIDGAKEMRILWQIIIPLSMPVMATVGLFYAVAHWNEFFQAIMYVTDSSKHPLQVVLRGILAQTRDSAEGEATIPTESLQMAAVILTALPILVIYPFIQRYFTQGMMLGAIKG